MCTLGGRIGDVALDFLHGAIVDERPLRGPRFESRRRRQLLHGLRQLGGKPVVHRLLHEQAVRAHAGLPGVAVFRRDCAFDRGIEIRIVEHDERRVAAELERQLFHRAGALRHQQLAGFGRSGERQLADDRIRGELGADLGGRSGNHVEHARRDARALGKLREGERRERRLRGGLQDDRAPRRNRRAGLTRNHRQRKVPRRDAGHHADRFLDDQQALVGLLVRDGIAVRALGFFTEPFEERRGVGHFAFRFGERFPLLGGHQPRQVLLAGEHQLEPAAHHSRALFRRLAPPFRKGARGGLDRPLRLGAAQLRHRSDDLAGRRVVDVEAIAPLDPRAVDVTGLTEEFRILERHAGAEFGGHGAMILNLRM